MNDRATHFDHTRQASTADRRRLRLLTWHVHGNYLYSLTQMPHDFIVPVIPGNPPGYAALGPGLPWGANISQVAAHEIRRQRFDAIIYQSRSAFEHDAKLFLSPEQRASPCVYIEHNPPEPHPTDTQHFFAHDRGVLVHVTHHNAMMWDGGAMPSTVIEHGVPEPAGVGYKGDLCKGIVVINNLPRRGRRLGADVFDSTRKKIPLDLIGMQSDLCGGLGEIPNKEVAHFMSGYRFFFSPIRYASLGLSLVEAMLVGLPIVGLGITELPTVIVNGHNGFVDVRPDRLVDCMRQLLDEPELARQWGENARRTAQQRFGIARFIDDLNALLARLVLQEER